MKRTFFVALFAVLCGANSAHATRLDGSVFLFPVDSTFRSVGRADYYNDLNQIGNASLSGTHSVSGPAVYQTPVQATSQYFYILEGPANPGDCFSTSLHVVADPGSLIRPTFDKTWTGDTRCASNPPRADGPPPTPDPLGGSIDDPYSDPIVISLQGPYKLTGIDDAVSFDINAVGHSVTLGWTARNEEIAFLALDRNRNGRIDDGSELFGNATPLPHGGRAVNGFEGLAQYDVNGDGMLDTGDSVWDELLLWADRNHNGVSEPAELIHIDDSSISAIELQHHWTGRRDQSGNWFGYEGHLHEGKRVRSFYDVFFVAAR